MSKLKDKYKAKIAEMDARMEELKAMEFTEDVEEEMCYIMAKTNTYLRAMHASDDEMYDI